ncbi:phosphohistidine phosphatase [Neorhizobium galegae]|uniref:SixA phosphatase family protein n=1 Tax=Neorhizobium galegae TaxID=399 RepID=UPI001AE9A983|nr:histidine phosphatase family protein [Neorhizobium galegae]MBP2549372.1 phosphohistidine phosphatase [Neorhizobium galegae]
MIIVSPPPSRIYLMRHARSGWPEPGGRDFDRTLDDHGYAEAELVASLAADKRYRPDLLISSTAVRCQETADAMHRAFGGEIDLVMIDELYNGPLDTYLSVLSAQTEQQSVMLIGHNPTMEELLEAMIGPDRASAVIPSGYPTAGLAVLDHGGPVTALAGSWSLRDFLTA